MTKVNKSGPVKHVVSIDYAQRLSKDMKGYVRSWDHYQQFGTIVGEDSRIYRLKGPNLLTYNSIAPYQRVVFQRDLKGIGDVAMNVRVIKW